MLYYPQQEERQNLYPLCRKKRAMEYRNWSKNDIRTSLLGYGCMRFTRKGGASDIDKAEKEVLCAAWRTAGCPGVEND